MALRFSIYFVVFIIVLPFCSQAKIIFSRETNSKINMEDVAKAAAAIHLLGGTYPMVALWGDYENLTEAKHTCWKTEHIEGAESPQDHYLSYRNRDRKNDAGQSFWPRESFQVHYGMTTSRGKAEILIYFLEGSITAKEKMDSSMLAASKRLLGQWEATSGSITWEVLEATDKCFVVKLPKFPAAGEGEAQCLIWVPENVAKEYEPNAQDFKTTADQSLSSCLSAYEKSCKEGGHLQRNVFPLCKLSQI
uniref:Putative secreted protein n=1 Tax=Amblyomma triste TaxID=251400 RepID=A0A023G214_AMBTT